MPRRPEVVRSYQRVFRPDRRIYAIDGRTLPIPGGIPIRWLTTATIVLIAGMLLAALKPVVIITTAALVGVGVRRLGRRRAALVAAAGTVVGCVAVGMMLRSLDWPLRLVVLPAVAATAALQLAPDGRSAHRFLVSWSRVQLAGRRRLHEPLTPVAEKRGALDARIVIASDHHSPRLQRACITGQATIRLAQPVTVRCGWRGQRTIRPLTAHRHRGGGGVMLDELHLAEGEHVEVRP